MPEIEIEGEPWLGLVVLGQMTRKWDTPGFYVLARAEEWHSDLESVTVWRGPLLQDERVPKSELREMECRTVLVENGFYTCPPILEDLQADVQEEAEKLLGEMANERTAETYSYIDLDTLGEKYDGEVFIKAEFGDAVAVNGELTLDRKPPRNYELTDEGGAVLGGPEEELELEKDILALPIAKTLTERLHRPIYKETVKAILDKLYPKDYIIWSSDNGHVEVWASKRAIRKARKEEELLERQSRERREAEDKARRQLQEEARKRDELERRLKVKRGGYPGPKDWSPRGRLPGDVDW